MEVSTTTSILNAGFSRNVNSLNRGSEESTTPNAFGIGRENQPEVQLSPQARILQQNEENASQLRDGLQEQREQASESREDEEQEQQTSGFVRLSTSEGDVSRSRIEAEKAAEVYRTVQGLV
ncbi:MAG: hypothetical protein ACFHVJ_01845 [Aestuariibacter sp.]